MDVSTAAVRVALAATGLTGRQVARHLGVTETTVSNWRHGWRKPNPYHARRIAALAGIDPANLYA